MSELDILPELPAKYRWHMANKKHWLYLAIERKHWYGWRTVAKESLRPWGLGMHYALVCGAEDLVIKSGVFAKA